MKETKGTIGERTALFLSSLGIKYGENSNSEIYWKACHQMIRDAGGDPEKTLSGDSLMGRDVVNMYFLTPEIATMFLVSDIPRLHQVFEALEYIDPIPDSSKNIAEIGGGPGIVSLWLAKKYPKREFTVYDYAENALKTGKTWAKKLGIKNIRHVQKSYSELAGNKTGKTFDFILGLSVLDLKIEVKSSPHLSLTEIREPTDNNKVILLNDFAKACSNLLEPDGTLWFSQGGFNDAGLLFLFRALRQNRLGIDWEKTVAKGEGEGPSFSFKEIHIISKPALPSVFKDAHEDTCSFLYRGTHSRFDKKTVIGHSDFETYLALLADGTKLADIKADRGEGNIERYTIYIKNGMLGFFSSNASGARSGFIYCSAAYNSSCQRLKSVIDSYKKSGIRITKEFWYPGIEGV